MLQAIPYHLGAFFCRFTPDWFCRGITWTLGEINWRLRPGTRRTVRENLRIIHPEWSERERRRVSRQVVHNFANSILLFLQLPFFDPEELFARIDVSAFRAELEKLGEKRALIVATAHLGPWELGGFALTHMGYTVHTVALDHRSAQVTKFYSDRRAYVGRARAPAGGEHHDPSRGDQARRSGGFDDRPRLRQSEEALHPIRRSDGVSAWGTSSWRRAAMPRS